MSYPPPPPWLQAAFPPRVYEPSQEVEISPLSNFNPPELRKWILEICNLTGKSPSTLARMSGLAASTLNRFLRKEDETNLNASSIEAIFKAAQELIEEQQQAGITAPIKRLDEKTNTYKVVGQETLYPAVESGGNLIRRALVRGWLGAKWYNKESGFLGWAEERMLMPFPKDTPRTIMHAFRITDESLAPFYLKGDFVIGGLIYKAHFSVLDFVGQHVVAFRMNDDDARIQCQLWKLVADPQSEFWLLPASESSEERAVHLGKGFRRNLDRVYISHVFFGCWKPFSFPIVSK